MLANYLYKNITWQFNQNPFSYLRCTPTSEEQFFFQAEKLADRYFPQKRKAETLVTEFCLNKIALLRPQNEGVKAALKRFHLYWDSYVKLRSLLNKDYAEFPSDGRQTRLEVIAELITKCTQFAADGECISKLISRCAETLELTDREERYLPYVVELYRIKYYCAVTLETAEDFSQSVSLAKMLQPELLKFDYFGNSSYRQNLHKTDSILSVVDCFGNSLVRFGGVNTQIDQKIFIYANGRNVFDTFCQSRFGNFTSDFRSAAQSAEVQMQYFVDGSKEVRKVKIKNLGASRKFVADVTLNLPNPARNATYFTMENALCVAAQNDEFYCAAAIVRGSKTVCAAQSKSLSYAFTVKKGETVCFDVCTVYAKNSPDLARETEELDAYGGARCPYVWDEASQNVRSTDITLSPTPNGCKRRADKTELSGAVCYSYQLGDSDVATFLDGAGNCATLLQGFVFGVKGESVYSVKYGVTSKLNEKEFVLDGDLLRYPKQKGSLTIKHSQNAKTYRVDYPAPSKTLFYFPLEEKSQITFDGKTFDVFDGKRHYRLHCEGKVESYTTSALECSEEKLRYKLSGNLDAGSCLAVCFASADSVSLTLSSQSVTPASAPIVRESLVSTYLNYVNDKNAFCINNSLIRQDALTVSAICYTNPQFVKNWIVNAYQNGVETFYYDAGGNRRKYCDRLALPLACVYYLSLAEGDLPDEIKKSALGTVFCENFGGKDLCVKALFLKKAASLEGFEKVKCLVEYNVIKKQIAADAKLYAYAQAIGAVPMYNPSKERLKDLCNKYEIPKSWYYVSQLENLYGLSICCGKLNVCPKVTTPPLEQFALHIMGKHIDTTFHKAAVQSMTLNGVQRFQPFRAQNLKNDDNTLEVRY